MQELRLRHAATLLLEYAIRIAPPESREWGRAMRGELSFVEGHWAALGWAFGGASVMAKHALISLLIPGRRGQAMLFDGGLFARNVSVRKALQVTAAGLTLASLLFFAAPPFRQALRVSLEGWKGVSGLTELRAVAKQAEARRDPEGMAFVAVRLRDDKESARLAEEAVQLDPNLTWVYAVVATNHRWLANIREWLPKLEQRDPHNAVFQLIAAASVDRSFEYVPRMDPQTRLEWVMAGRNPLARAFASPKFDDYLDRLRDLDRRVVRRYRFNDPFLVIWWEDDTLPSSSVDISMYAQFVRETGQTLEAKGDGRGAAELYWSVARFGQVIDSQGHEDFEKRLGLGLQAGAYEQLQRLSEKGGNVNEAALFGYLTCKFNKYWEESRDTGQRAFEDYVIWRNAFVLQLSSFMMAVFSVAMVASALILVIRRRRRGREDPPHPQPAATIVAFTSGAVVLLSAATIYLTYRPYWYIFQRSVLNGDRSHTLDLSVFLFAVRARSQVPAYEYRVLRSFLLSGSASLHVYLWTGIVSAGIACLLVILLREIRGRLSAGRLQNHTQVP